MAIAAGTVHKESGKTVKIVAHHVLLRSKAATDNPKYMATVCTECHTTKAHQPGGVLYQWYEESKAFSIGYRDPTFMSILRCRIIEHYPYARITYGNITAADRKNCASRKPMRMTRSRLLGMTSTLLWTTA